jgi:NADH:ubiquinone oxidoreductase subunit F (NADH-binding)
MLEARAMPRLLAGWHPGRPMSLAEHRAVHGGEPGSTPRPGQRLIETIEQAGLRGRGGSGFPTAAKMHAVAAARGRRGSVVVANGSESEPASGKDEALMAHAPHLVLDGVRAAADAVGAGVAIVCIKQTSTSAAEALEIAIRERGGLDRVSVELCEVPADYVAGEESALMNFLNTGTPLPLFTPPLPFERGVYGRPTLVQNVETLAHVALIARYGAEWFRAFGTASDSGSTLVTIDGAVDSPAVYEIETGTSLGALIEMAGGSPAEMQGCLVGGYGGMWVTAEQAVGLPLTRSVNHQRDVGLGPGIVHVLPRDRCGLRETAAIARYLAEESAGQCGPCAFGLPAIADALDDMAAGAARPGTGRWVRWWANQVEGRGACHHPDGASRMVRSALVAFAADVARHEAGEACLHRAPFSGAVA